MLRKPSPGIPPYRPEPTCTVCLSHPERASEALLASFAPPQLPTCRIPRLTTLAFSHGANALLVHLSGTLPVNFRGTTYRFPVSIWIPHAYPREPPLIYVVPTETMMIRPGQHVDPQGLVYHPYLVGWAEFWDVGTTLT
ncbi:component of actin cortical patches LAS17 [Fusarium albosuccineum]|uniref:Component of actin cortical patches LAS17 n=1 Tax=Fusarium albosuccineum TaxID=1237068 RepID=A0A8H4PIK6_9HYPO|nr:component of actin cortical patches LAS17 [Fusarium albosuccineum]